jgi:hypothetical protein
VLEFYETSNVDIFVINGLTRALASTVSINPYIGERYEFLIYIPTFIMAVPRYGYSNTKVNFKLTILSIAEHPVDN